MNTGSLLLAAALAFAPVTAHAEPNIWPPPNTTILPPQLPPAGTDRSAQVEPLEIPIEGSCHFTNTIYSQSTVVSYVCSPFLVFKKDINGSRFEFEIKLDGKKIPISLLSHHYRALGGGNTIYAISEIEVNGVSHPQQNAACYVKHEVAEQQWSDDENTSPRFIVAVECLLGFKQYQFNGVAFAPSGYKGPPQP